MPWIKFIENLTLLIPIEIVLGIVIVHHGNRRYSGYARILIHYLIIALLVDLTSRWLGKYFQNNLLLVPIYALLELLILSQIYLQFMLKRRRQLFLILSIVSILYISLEILYLSSSSTIAFQSYSRTLCSFIMTLYALNYFIEGIKFTNHNKNLINLNTVFLFYFACNFFIYLPINFFINATTDTKYLLWIFNLFIIFIYYLAILRAIWRSGGSKKPLYYGSS